MKILNFTAVEILPALLNENKNQTIRPAWKKPEFARGICINGSPKYDSNGGNPIIEKLPRFSVSEKITLMWNQRSPHKVFCSNCGGPFLKCRCEKRGIALSFRKELGKSVITEVFKIEIGRDTEALKPYWVNIGKILQQADFVEDLPKKDGFRTSGHMFEWFNERYNLTRPKPFWVYRWRWL